MSLGIRLLLTESAAEAQDLAVELDGLNKDRRAIESGMQQEALKALEKFQLDEQQLPWGLCIYQDDWHQGVIGILASRIKERFHRPVIALAKAEEGVLKGSARSIPGLHIRDTLDAIAKRKPELLSKFGGHAMAAGLSLREQDLTVFQHAFDEEVRRQLDASQLQAQYLTDGQLAPDEVTLSLAEQLRELAPWGQGFVAPSFDGQFEIIEQRLVGEKHLKMKLRQSGHQIVDAIAFNVDLAIWPDSRCQHISAVYQLEVNEFRGVRSVQLLVQYLESL